MKIKLVLSLVACGASLVLCPGLLHAQDATPAPATSGTDTSTGGHSWGHHGGGGGGPTIEMLTKQLDLTPDQQEKIKPILDTLHTAVQTARQDTSLTPEDKMAQIKDARQTANTAMDAVLTPDQQAKFEAMQEKMRARRHAEGGPGGSPEASPSASP